MGKQASTMFFDEPQWGPHYKQTHHDFRKTCRDFVEKEMMPFVDEWDLSGTYPPELHAKAYAAGLYGSMWPKEYGGTPPVDADAFHDLIYNDELSRAGTGGVLASAFFSFSIGLPPIIDHGSDFLKNMIVRDIVTGKKIMALAISEPFAGSDVANIRSSAVKSGDHYIVNGEKKWITSGMKAHYYTMAVRTDESIKGAKAISLLAVPTDLPGIQTRRLNTQGWKSSNTAYITFDDVKVPCTHLIGQESQGFKYVMWNFNHERWALAVQASRMARVCLSSAAVYSQQRKTFNKRLGDHQVIRHKVAEMARLCDATHAMLEAVTYRMTQESVQELGGPIALLKVQSTKTMETCAREASQIYGGNSYLLEGRGSTVERIYREVRVMAIGGGSEEIMYDLAMRQAKL